jgi:hypothetical protein
MPFSAGGSEIIRPNRIRFLQWVGRISEAKGLQES